MKYKDGLENLRMPRLMLVLAAISLLGITSGSQGALATICPPMCVADELAEVEELVEDETMTSNQTAVGNMTGANATNSN